ncbi:MAG: hypothetical protein ACOY45_05865 [Pseudomonadota bacterium]
MGPIHEEWLKECGFRWSQFERQSSKHWTLWLGAAMEDGPDLEDIGLELAPGYDGKWYCWLRADTAGRYSRFVHVRHLRWQEEVTDLIAAIAGRPFDPRDVFYGGLRTKAQADRFRAEAERLDRKILDSERWRRDAPGDAIGGATADHLAAFERACEKAGKRLGHDGG